MLLVHSFDLQGIFYFVKLGDALFDERLRLASQDGFVDHGRAGE